MAVISNASSVAFPKVVAGDPVRISASTYVAFLQCPESAMARFRGEYGPDSVASFRGGLAHRMFARHLTNGPITEGEFRQVCNVEIGSSNLNHKLGAIRLKPSELSGIVAETQALYERFRGFPQEGFAGAEEFIEHEAGSDVQLVGSIDAVFDDGERIAAGGVRLVDWKTGELGDPMPQLRYYAALWVLDRGVIPTIVEAVSVKTGERLAEQPTIATVRTTLDELAHMVSEVRGAWKAGSELARQGGPSCRFCPLLDSCDEGRVAAEVLTIPKA